MKSEIQIILEKQNPYKQGNCFEVLVRSIIEQHRYKVSSNVNITGMEIDLIAEHKDRPNEVLYVECKAKEKVSADELSKFAFNVMHKRANFGYFIRTKELEHHAAGLLKEMQEDERYNNLTFFEPEKVIELLAESGDLKEIEIDESEVTKRIFVVTYVGDFFIFLLKNSLAPLPTSFYLVDAKTGKEIRDEKIISILKKSLPEIKDLKQKYKDEKVEPVKNESSEIETLSEVHESENWFDYLPASTNHFVGRELIRSDIFSFFNKALNNETKRRVFYLTGKSGWGKSSMVADIRGRSRNKYYKNKYFTLAIDSRSALSSNFVALSFARLIRKATEAGFIKKSLFQQELSFTSTFDLLNSDSISEILSYLERSNKALILIFDQFEDIFRKENLFKTFYKFLTDVTDLQSNIIVGFSWKTEILIPSENEAYHLWQQAKAQTTPFLMPAFGKKEVNGVISQLESSIGKVDIELRRRLVESSQSYPWLVKKLCIHVFDQIKSGKEKEELIDENLNIEPLFNADLEKLSSEETQGLKYIAQRAFDGSFFEASEVDDKIPEKVINSLRDKRLIIRSGLNFNIYWDIFRDYIVTGKVPRIGESYIIRSSVNTCLEIFLVFDKTIMLSSLDIKNRLGKNITRETIENCLIDLRSIGLIRKIEKQEKFAVSKQVENVSVKFFKHYITTKFKSYSILHQIENLDAPITNDKIATVLKDNFQSYTYQDSTWRQYSNYLINWFTFSDIHIKDILEVPAKGGGRKVSFYKSISVDNNKIDIRNSPLKIANALNELKANSDISNLEEGIIRDLCVLRILEHQNNTFSYSEVGNQLATENIEVLLIKQAIQLEKVKITSDYLNERQGRTTSKNLIADVPTLFTNGLKDSSKVIYASKLLGWGKYIIEKTTLHNIKYKSLGS